MRNGDSGKMGVRSEPMNQSKKKAPSGRGAPAGSVDEYPARVPGPYRKTLEKLRAAVKAAAPGAVDGISRGIPGYKLNGYRRTSAPEITTAAIAYGGPP